MTNIKHTPWPWEILAGSYGGVFILGPPVGYDGEYENPADAHLIAAAPDLLEALEQVLIEYDDAELANAEPVTLTAAILEARAAIAKAKGQTK